MIYDPRKDQSVIGLQGKARHLIRVLYDGKLKAYLKTDLDEMLPLLYEQARIIGARLKVQGVEGELDIIEERGENPKRNSGWGSPVKGIIRPQDVAADVSYIF